MRRLEIVKKIYKRNLVIEERNHFGRQCVFRFENNYGLSVIEQIDGAGPKYNIAVIKFNEKDKKSNDYEIDYKNKIATNDVLTDKEEVIKHLLESVRSL